MDDKPRKSHLPGKSVPPVDDKPRKQPRDDKPRKPQQPRNDKPRKPQQPRPIVVIGIGVALALAVNMVMGPSTPEEPEPTAVGLTEVVAAVHADEVVDAAIFDSSRTVQVTVEGQAAVDRHAAATIRATADDATVPAELAIPEGWVPPLEPVDGTEARYVERVEVDAPTFTIEAIYPVGYGTELTTLLLEAGIDITAAPVPPANTFLGVLLGFVPFLILIGFVWYLMSKQGAVAKMGRGKADAVEVPATRFTDVAGVDEALDDLKEIVAYLHDPKRYDRSGAVAPRGVLLEGPPGTGKTLIARAVAGEAGVPFFAMAGSDFVEMFVGVGARRVRDLFDKASKAGRAVIFIDEIDAIGKSRSGGKFAGGDSERENTLLALLDKMDGFNNSNVIVIAATNRGDLLDSALTRPGRFDRRVNVPPPDRGGRTRILEVHAKGKKLAEDIDLVAVARRTPGMTGADLAGLVNSAALEAARAGRDEISTDDVEQALAKAMLGAERRSAIITPHDQRVTAWHEAGHTVAALLQADADDPVTVTIVPRGPAGGVTWMSGNDDMFLTRKSAKAQLVVAMAGRAAEEVALDGEFTQGASGDLQSATDLATRMVTQYGMTDAGLAFIDPERYRYTASTAQRVDAAVEVLLAEALETARMLVADHAELLGQVVAELLDKETVHLADLRRIAGELHIELPAPRGET